jgi:hypothetical protein
MTDPQHTALAQRIIEHVFSPDAPTDPDARVALVQDLLARAWPCPNCVDAERSIKHAYDGAADLSRQLEVAEAAVYVPNQWVCPSCGFCVTKMILRAADGAVGIDTSEVQDICPNDGSSLRRLTWEQNATEAHEEWRKANERAAAAEAKLARAETPTPDHAALARLTRYCAQATHYIGYGVDLIDHPNGPYVLFAEVEAALSRASQAAPAAPTTEPCVQCGVAVGDSHEESCGLAPGRHAVAAPSGEPLAKVRRQIAAMPKRVEWISGQRTDYVQRSEVLACIDAAAPCPSCGSTDGFHTMRNCPKRPASLNPSSELAQGIAAVAWRCVKECKDYMPPAGAPVMCPKHEAEAAALLAAHPSPAVPPPGSEPSGRTHDLKCWPEFFAEVAAGRKTFEIRKDDRGFRAGDAVRLREYDPTTGLYSGAEVVARIGYVTAWEQLSGLVVFSLLSAQPPPPAAPPASEP